MSLLRLLGVTSNSQASPASVPELKAPVIGSADSKQFGLENFGNTCYINAIFQALYFCPPFRDLVIATPDSSNPAREPPDPLPSSVPMQSTLGSPPSKSSWSSSKGMPKRRDSSIADNSEYTSVSISPVAPPIPATPPSLFSALRSLFIHIAQNPQDKGKVSPTAFVKKVKDENEAFRNTNHQDAHELLNFLLNKVVEDLEMDATADPQADSLHKLTQAKKVTSLGLSPPKKTLVHLLFEGVLTSETRCLTCETVSSRDESFLDLSIDIEANSSVTACLRAFSASEMLCQRNKFSCDSCSGLQEAEKRMKVKKLPNVLALHLKRFKYQEDVQKFIKLSYRVAFPLELRLFNTVDDAEGSDRLYELFAIVVHIGGGPHHGHYTSIVKSQGAWYLYDDDAVESINECDIPKYFGESNVGSGYVLFYQVMDLDYKTVGLSPPFADSPSVVPEHPSLPSSFRLPSSLSEDAANISNSDIPSPVNLPLRILEANKNAAAATDTYLNVGFQAGNTSPLAAVAESKGANLQIHPSTYSQVVPSKKPLPIIEQDRDENWRGWLLRNKSVKKKGKDSLMVTSTRPDMSQDLPAQVHSLSVPRGSHSKMEETALKQQDASITANALHEHILQSLLPVEPSASSTPSRSPGQRPSSLALPTIPDARSPPSELQHIHSSQITSRPLESENTSSGQPGPQLTSMSSVAIPEKIRVPLRPTPSTSLGPPRTDASPIVSKKASRKLSLTSMPLKLTGLVSKRDKDRDRDS